VLTQPGIPNHYSLSTCCYGSRLRTIEDQAFASVAMGFRRIELGILDAPVKLNGFEDSRRETGITVTSVIAGCLDPRSETMSGSKLGSLVENNRECALNSLRRHIKLAQRYGCSVVIVRGCELEDKPLREEAEKLAAKLHKDPANEALRESAREFVHRVHKKSHRQLEHICRALFSLATEFPETKLAIEAGSSLVDLFNFESVGLALSDLARLGLGYWHDTGHVHLRERLGLEPQGRWLDAYSSRMLGVHLQDAAEGGAELPPGAGEVDFKLVKDFLPGNAERVLEINARHGRAEILAAVQFLADKGF
jgi:sugar phosphate isomerase/epimerase